MQNIFSLIYSNKQLLLRKSDKGLHIRNLYLNSPVRLIRGWLKILGIMVHTLNISVL